ncbi:hypothetical protein Pcinc_000503 [Petrolisthes cinctipes]|uniref:Integrase catalytic domain-containing protein n=1 Tax=Petrolisthes cinctipes TaxID=88211 RepID=A0AAE1GPN8_PETCI|nr:hypothetical protein Pcinc_000503 [Petrolisthes cinctipes]
MVNYYHRLLPKIASTMAPLYSVLAGKPKDLTWGPPQEDAYQRAKDALVSSTLLVFPNPKKPLIVTTDASNIAIGAVLEQVETGCDPACPAKYPKFIVTEKPAQEPSTNHRGIFAHIHVDFVGPLPPSDGHRYLLTNIDRSTRWPEAIPMANTTSTSCASSLLSGWISRFGIPEHITSDRGTTFTSHLWTSLGQLMGTTVHHTTAYNPEANGMVERLHRTLKAALMSRCNSYTWSSQLPWALLGLRTTPKEDLDASPAEMVFSEPLVVPGEFFPDAPSSNDINHLRNIVGKLAPCKQTYKPPDHCYIPRDLHSTKHVFLRTDAQTPPLTPPYSGLYEVIERRKKAFLLRIKGSNDWVSIDRLKPAYLQDDDPPPVRLSRAGRPLSHTSGHSH